jgi:DNA invertase Pin-like site-specific DNA recombinase
MNFLVNKEIKNNMGFEYCRKSTESEDRQVYSLEDQHSVNLKIAASYEIKIKKTYTESKSAKIRGRPEFNAMVSAIEKGKNSVIVCWNLNRLARNAVDGAVLIELMDLKKLSAIVTPGKVYYNSGEDKLLLQIEFGLAKKYSDDLGPAVMRGMLSKIKRGWWPGKPKPGYLNKKERGEIIQIVDDGRFLLLRKAIELFLNGSTVQNIVDTLNDKYGYRTVSTAYTGNRPLSLSSFYRILNDPFYYGLMIWNGEECAVSSELPRLMSEDEYW